MAAFSAFSTMLAAGAFARRDLAGQSRVSHHGFDASDADAISFPPPIRSGVGGSSGIGGSGGLVVVVVVVARHGRCGGDDND